MKTMILLAAYANQDEIKIHSWQYHSVSCADEVKVTPDIINGGVCWL